MRGWSTYPSLHSTPGYWSTPRGATLLLLDIEYRYFYTPGYTDTLLLLDIDTFIHQIHRYTLTPRYRYFYTPGYTDTLLLLDIEYRYFYTPGYTDTLLLLDIDTFIHQDTQIHSYF